LRRGVTGHGVVLELRETGNNAVDRELAQWAGVEGRWRKPCQRTRENERGKRGWCSRCCRGRCGCGRRSRRGGLCYLRIRRRTGTCDVSGGIGNSRESSEGSQDGKVANKAMGVCRDINGRLSFIRDRNSRCRGRSGASQTRYGIKHEPGLNPEWETNSKDCECDRYTSIGNHHAKAIRSPYVREEFENWHRLQVNCEVLDVPNTTIWLNCVGEWTE